VNPALIDAVASSLPEPAPSAVVVALGGGADSAALLAAAIGIGSSTNGSMNVRGVFVDHRLTHSAMLGDAARTLGETLGVPVTTLAAPVDDGPDLESRARTARYRAIEADLDTSDVALTAHTLDDQAETVLMRLTAGSGATGLAGIPHRRDRWIRPFLSVPKAQLRAEADRLALPYVDDPANTDDRFLRSRVRNRVLPVLGTEMDANAAAGLARSAELLGRDEAILDGEADRIPLTIIGGAVLLPIAPLVSEPVPIASRACRRAIRRVGDGYPGTHTDVEAMLDTAATGTTHTLSGGWLAVNEGAMLRLGPRPVPDEPVHLPLGGSVLWGGAWYRLVVDDRTPIVPGGRRTAVALDVVSDGVTVRGVRDGDRLDIGIGDSSTGSTPVVELLRRNGVAAPLRPVSPLAVVDAKIAAVVGVRTAVWAIPHHHGARAIIEREVGT
jgi:tRNA(Ile)-lysidine synthetase-like protein